MKKAITGRVVGLLHDRARGEAPVTRRIDGLFGPRAVAWRVHGDVTSMMVGGVSSLLPQMPHPAVLAGVAQTLRWAFRWAAWWRGAGIVSGVAALP